jgi:hypothetical protein
VAPVMTTMGLASMATSSVELASWEHEGGQRCPGNCPDTSPSVHLRGFSPHSRLLAEYLSRLY